MPPKKDPVMKLEPTIKEIGRSIVKSVNKFTLLLFELFCIPIIRHINKQELKIKFKDNFLIKNCIYLEFTLSII